MNKMVSVSDLAEENGYRAGGLSTAIDLTHSSACQQ